ncbi:MAG: Fic family protein [Candidatus Sedimenticola sp. (ex Thyasira tokunagai)]
MTGRRVLLLTAVIARLAYYYDLTNQLHPFPEGNGRTQRLFIEHLAAIAGLPCGLGTRSCLADC